MNGQVLEQVWSLHITEGPLGPFRRHRKAERQHQRLSHSTKTNSVIDTRIGYGMRFYVIQV